LIQPINTVTDSVEGAECGFFFPKGVAVNPSGTKVYVTNSNADQSTGTVSVIDAATNKVTANVLVGRSP
jgi:YVTN family beta-propeller protein